jgi:hypothetical protein
MSARTACAICCVAAVFLSLTWQVPYVYCAIGFATWTLAGHLLTLDDEMPGGWSNPDGSAPLPWAALMIKTAVLLGLVALALFVPSVRALGA